MAEPRWTLQLFSTPKLFETESGETVLAAGKPLALLAYVALEEEPVSREDLARLLWPEADDRRGRASVRQAVWTVRQVLGQDCFTSDDPLSLAAGVLTSDLHRFRHALDQDDLALAAELWKGPFLEDLEFPRAREWQGWVDRIRLREGERLVTALSRGAAKAKEAGDLETAIRWLRKGVEVRPFHAPVHIALVETLLDAHNLADAALALADARDALGGVEGMGAAEAESLDALGERIDALRFGVPGGDGPPVMRPEFVGRVTEFSRLSRSWRVTAAGRSQVALILGPPGIGKTRLAEEVALLAEAEGCPVVTVKAVEVERSLDWGLVGELVRLLHGLPGAAGISNRSAAVLAQLVPSLAGLRSPMGTGEIQGSMGAAAVTDAVLDLVSAVSEESPTLVVIDDLQWVDRASRAALSHLARALNHKPVFLLFTCRTEEDPEVAKAVVGLEKASDQDTVRLGPLTEAEVSELLALMLDPLEPGELHALARKMFGVTRGNPLFLVEVLKLLQAQGLIHPTRGGRWGIDPACLEGSLPVPPTVESAIQRHLEALDPHARTVAAALAAQARPLRPEDLRRLGNLDPFEVSEGIGGLFERELIRRDPEGRLQFVHDAVASAAARHLKPPRPEGLPDVAARVWGRWYQVVGAGAVAVVALLALLLAIDARGGGGFGFGLGVGSDPTFPYGRGRLWAMGDSGAYWILPPDREEAAWDIREADPPLSRRGLFGPYGDARGTIHWFARGSDGPDSQPFLGVPREDGSVDPLWKVEGADIIFKTLSPDGSWVLVSEADVRSEVYQHDLVRVSLSERTGTTLFQARDRLNGCDWAPDGQRIVCAQRLERDSVLFLAPDGQILAQLGIPESSGDIDHPDWCPDSDHLLVVTEADGVSALALIRFSTLAYSLHPGPGTLLNHPQCLGSSPWAVVEAAAGGEFRLWAMDLSSDAAFPIEGIPPQRFRSVQWLPESVQPVITAVKFQEDSTEIRLGERRQIPVSGVRTDGRFVPIRVETHSTDPSVASVDSMGVITANGIGDAEITARYARWLEDTLGVRVTPVDHPLVLLRDEFGPGSLEDWTLFGDPLAKLVGYEGDWVLSLEGDGSFQDGLVSKRTFPLEAGATAEVEFKIFLNQRHRQKISLCVEPDSPWAVDPNDPYTGAPAETGVCLRFPGDEDIKFDPREASLGTPTPVPTETILLPASFDPEEWSHLALQIRPDGTVSVVVDHAVMYEARHGIDPERSELWRVRIKGASENTDLFVRRVVVWPGERY